MDEMWEESIVSLLCYHNTTLVYALLYAVWRWTHPSFDAELITLNFMDVWIFTIDDDFSIEINIFISVL